MKCRLASVLSVVFIMICSPAFGDYKAGVAAYERGDYAAALREFRPLAEKGHAGAQNQLGNMYRYGMGVRKAHTKAVTWFRAAAAQGHAGAQNQLGVMYFRGEGVPKDYVRAHMWFNLAVSQGDKRAARNREFVAKRMTAAQIAEAERMAREWKPKRQ
jgi:TPR repeat protein